MIAAGDFEGRRAPYAPISALEKFFERIRDRSVPEHVDHKFLQRLNVASNNEYSLLSALKFLGVLDDRGRPTHSYRLLQSTDRFQDTLQHLVETAYRPVFDQGAHEWPLEDLVNFFRLSSSASQAKNAARFFQAVCKLSGLSSPRAAALTPAPVSAEPAPAFDREPEGPSRAETATNDLVLRAKAKLMEKLPPPRDDWSADDYKAICQQFLDMIRSLD
jgi:hypothetical protein